jgi:hypothetical protein
MVDWYEAEATATRHLLEYDTLVDNGVGESLPTGHRMICCDITYNVKQDGRHKAQLVAGEQLMDPTLEVYTVFLNHYRVSGSIHCSYG